MRRVMGVLGLTFGCLCLYVAVAGASPQGGGTGDCTNRVTWTIEAPVGSAVTMWIESAVLSDGTWVPGTNPNGLPLDPGTFINGVSENHTNGLVTLTVTGRFSNELSGGVRAVSTFTAEVPVLPCATTTTAVVDTTTTTQEVTTSTASSVPSSTSTTVESTSTSTAGTTSTSTTSPSTSSSTTGTPSSSSAPTTAPSPTTSVAEGETPDPPRILAFTGPGWNLWTIAGVGVATLLLGYYLIITNDR